MHRLTTFLFCLLLLGCSRTPEANYARYLRQGQEFAAKKDYPRAILQFKNASKFMSSEAEPYYQLGLAEIALGDTASAVDCLNRAVALNPKHLEATLALSDLFTHSSHLSALNKGRQLAEQALSLAPGNLKAQNLIALADLRSGKAKAACVQLESLLTRFPNDVQTSINLALVRLALNDRSGAEELLRKTAVSASRDATALFALADFYNAAGDSSKAVEWYGRGLAIQPDNAQALAALGKLQAGAGHKQEADDAFARLAETPDRRFRYAYAIRLFSSGRKEAAVAAFERIYKDNPLDRDARTHLIGAWLDSGRTAEADDLLGKAIAADPRDVDALAQRARMYLTQAKPDEAEKDIKVVQQYRPEFAETHYLIAQLHRHRHNEQLQRSELSEALRLDPNYAPARIELAGLLISKEPQRALTLIDSAPENQRQSPDFQIQRIWPLIELKRVDEARAAIDVLLGSGHPDVLLQDAVLRMRQKDFIGARVSAQKALAANPADVRALELIIRCAVGEKQPAKGLEMVRTHAAQNPKLAGVQMFLGRIELQTGKAAQARAAFEAAKAADPGLLDAAWTLIDLDIAERKLEDARRRIAPLMHGSTEAAATTKLALVEETAGNHELAVQDFRKVLAIKPFDAVVLNNLAYILAEFTGNPTEALRYAQTAKELAPQDPAIDDTLGWTYYRMGRYDDAVRHLELAVKQGTSARRQAHLAMAYARQGNGVRARQLLQSALKMDPALPEGSLAQRVVGVGAPALP